MLIRRELAITMPFSKKAKRLDITATRNQRKAGCDRGMLNYYTPHVKYFHIL
jgi:hypothetical protein